MKLWQALLFPGALLPPPQAGIEPQQANVYARLRPLVGGPSLLRVHVAVACHERVYDFLPAQPSAVGTAAALLSGQEVEGRIRCRPLGRRFDSTWRCLGRTECSPEELREYAEQLPTRLSLTHNNCWTFAGAIAEFALQADGSQQQ